MFFRAKFSQRIRALGMGFFFFFRNVVTHALKFTPLQDSPVELHSKILLNQFCIECRNDGVQSKLK